MKKPYRLQKFDTRGLERLLPMLRDPAPEFAFEVGAEGIAMARTRTPSMVQFMPLPLGCLEPSPVKENVLKPEVLLDAVRNLVPPASGRGKRTAALILPDNAVRIAVLDFDKIPERDEELRPLVAFRMRKALPFDIEQAQMSYFAQADKKVIVVVAPSEILAHYEQPFRAAGLQPGLVTVSSLALLDLLPTTGSIVLARLSPGNLTVIALTEGVVTIARSLELAPADPGSISESDPLDEISADIYSTITYIEDRSGVRPEKLFLAGFGGAAESACTRLAVELDMPVAPVLDAHPGLAGYLASVAPASSGKKAVA